MIDNDALFERILSSVSQGIHSVGFGLSHIYLFVLNSNWLFFDGWSEIDP